MDSDKCLGVDIDKYHWLDKKLSIQLIFDVHIRGETNSGKAPELFTSKRKTREYSRKKAKKQQQRSKKIKIKNIKLFSTPVLNFLNF